MDFPPSDHPGQLGKSQWEKDHSMEHQQQVVRGEMGVPGSALLPLPHPLDAHLIGGKAAGVLKDFALGIVQGFPLQHSEPLPILAR